MELNPNHGVTAEVRELWHKLCAILLFKSGATKAQITVDDIERFTNSGLTNITVRPKDRVGLSLAETYARDPSFYSGTFCVACATHRPLSEFVWDGTTEQVGS